MKPTHIVLRKFPGPNGELKAGTEVDASEWRNAVLLEKQRFIRRLDGVEASSDVGSGNPDLRARVTEIILADLRSNGPIANALQSGLLNPHVSMDVKSKSAQKQRTK